jgi:hypothetical protein
MSDQPGGPFDAAELPLARARRREALRATLAHEADCPPQVAALARPALLARHEAWDRRVRLLLAATRRCDTAT